MATNIYTIETRRVLLRVAHSEEALWRELQTPKSAAEYRDVIGSMLEEADRLTRLVDSLLTLSRADASHIQVQRNGYFFARPRAGSKFPGRGTG
jgi:signal transduction histidine kinase